MSDVPAHRCFLSVELPFCVQPSHQVSGSENSDWRSGAKKNKAKQSLNEVHSVVGRKINSFLSAPVLLEFLQRGTTEGPSSSSMAPHAPVGSTHLSSAGNVDEEGGPCTATNNGDYNRVSATSTPNSTGEYDIASRARYNPDPVYSVWCGTDWASEDDFSDKGEDQRQDDTFQEQSVAQPHPTADGGTVEHRQQYVEQKMLNDILSQGSGGGGSDHNAKRYTTATESTKRKAISLSSGVLPSRGNDALISSTIPQLLIHGYNRNDVLLQVRRRVRVKRVRCKKSGDLLKEEEIGWSSEDEDGNSSNFRGDGLEHTGKQKCPRLEAQVLGVVSRELELARPADFAFSLFTEEEKAQAPHLCSGDLFPPAHYLQEKATVEATYEMGRDMNGAVLNAEAKDSSVVPTSSDVQGFETGEIPLLMANPTDEVLPPPQSPAQVQFLSRMGSSPNGLSPQDPDEIRTIARLLEARPVWSMSMLSDAAWQTGLCPRRYLTKRVIHCLTYVIPIAAFNRLRIRLDYNPYLSPISVMYQRLMVRLVRRHEIGMLLRDISRSKHIEDVIQQIRNDPKNPIPPPWVVPPTDSTSPINPLDISRIPRCGLREHFCQTILRGQLSISFQLVDLMELESYQRTVSYVIAEAGGGKAVSNSGMLGNRPLPKEYRSTPHGWLTEQASSQAISQYSSALADFIQSEVVPKLKEYNETLDKIASTSTPLAMDGLESDVLDGRAEEEDSSSETDDSEHSGGSDGSDASSSCSSSNSSGHFSAHSSLNADLSDLSSEDLFDED